jgi:pantetheine-phosphate adenylyltransferase
MGMSGLISLPFSFAATSVAFEALQHVAALVSRTLWVQLIRDQQVAPNLTRDELLSTVCAVYTSLAKVSPLLDVRVTFADLSVGDARLLDSSCVLDFSTAGEGHLAACNAARRAQKWDLCVGKRDSLPLHAQQLLAKHINQNAEGACHSDAPLLGPEWRGKHEHFAMGGTFDRLHSGHKLLLTAALLCMQYEKSERSELLIGLADGPLLQSKDLKDVIQPWTQRRDAVETFLKALRPDVCLNLFQLLDPWGPTITEASITGMVVSPETRKGALAINTKRQTAGLQPLEIIEISYVGDASSDTKLSSSTLRAHSQATTEGP